MWQRRILTSGMVVVLVLAVTSLAGFGRQQPSVVASGQVQITMAPDGLSALVSVDEEQPGGPDGVVDQAFLVQVEKPMRVAFAGEAALVFTTTRLAVTMLSGSAWVFSVVGKDTEPVPPSEGLTVIPVVGLSHYWRRLVDRTHGQLAATLLMRLCETGALASRGPGCDECVFGGPGETGCEITCPEGTCSASCGDGYHACCSCAEGCRCCGNDQQRPSAATAPAARR